jgi:hypothetical protein
MCRLNACTPISRTMKELQKGPKNKSHAQSDIKKGDTYPGTNRKPSGKSPESVDDKESADKGTDGNTKRWEYPEESAHVKNSPKDISNKSEGAYKNDDLGRGRTSEDDDDDLKDHTTFDDEEDEEF